MTHTDQDVIHRIIELNRKCADFWNNAHGWAPEEAANLLSSSRLDWQVSLSETLSLWLDPPDKDLTAGELILAWTNLGALVEGACKLFFSVYYLDFQNDTELLKKVSADDRKKGVHKSPDTLVLENYRIYIEQKGLLDKAITDFICLVQQRRNSIHAFKDREIGSSQDFREAVRTYLCFLEAVEVRLPYP